MGRKRPSALLVAELILPGVDLKGGIDPAQSQIEGVLPCVPECIVDQGRERLVLMADCCKSETNPRASK